MYSAEPTVRESRWCCFILQRPRYLKSVKKNVKTNGTKYRQIALRVDFKGLAPVAQTTFKPIFHQKTGLRWVPAANAISTKNMKCTCPTQRPNARHPTPPIFHWELGLRLLPNAKKSTQKNEMYMADARNVLHPTPEIPTCWYFLR